MSRRRSPISSMPYLMRRPTLARPVTCRVREGGDDGDAETTVFTTRHGAPGSTAALSRRAPCECRYSVHSVLFATLLSLCANSVPPHAPAA